MMPPKLKTRLRVWRMGLATLFGGRPGGWFVPYRYAHTVDAPVAYPALEPVFAAAEPRFAEMLRAIDRHAASLLDNILFGKVAYGQARGAERVRDIVAQVIDALDLRAAVMEVGLSYHVGIAGGRLTGAQRQKLGIARAVLKRPDILVLNEATASLDGATQNALVDNLLKEFEGRGLVWAVHRPSMARRFDRAIVFRSGKGGRERRGRVA